jgi:hypothetical protein
MKLNSGILGGLALLVAGSAIALALSAEGGQTASDVSGHVMRMGGSDPIYLKKADGRRVDISRQKQKRIVLETGDDLQPQGNAWVIYYSIAKRASLRKPALRTTTVLLPQPLQTGRKGLVYGSRPQGERGPLSNRLLALNSESQPFVLIGEVPLTFGAVTLTPDVKPSKVTVALGEATREISLGGAGTLRSQGIVHQLDISSARDLLSTTNPKFNILVTFSDGSRDSASFEMPKSTDFNEPTSVLRRALTRYYRSKPSDPDWFFRLTNASLAYEDLGCYAQASSMVINWWFEEPDNESAMFALRAIGMEFRAGAIEREFGPKAPD